PAKIRFVALAFWTTPTVGSIRVPPIAKPLSPPWNPQRKTTRRASEQKAPGPDLMKPVGRVRTSTNGFLRSLKARKSSTCSTKLLVAPLVSHSAPPTPVTFPQLKTRPGDSWISESREPRWMPIKPSRSSVKPKGWCRLPWRPARAPPKQLDGSGYANEKPCSQRILALLYRQLALEKKPEKRWSGVSYSPNRSAARGQPAMPR